MSLLTGSPTLGVASHLCVYMCTCVGMIFCAWRVSQEDCSSSSTSKSTKELSTVSILSNLTVRLDCYINVTEAKSLDVVRTSFV